MESTLQHLSGAGALEAWFGYWPTFHDAEVLSLSLNREGTSELRIHTWEMADRSDWHGHYESEKHAVVTFLIQEIVALELSGFSAQNAIAGFNIAHKDDAFVVSFQPRCGLAGSITAKSVAVRVEPSQAPARDPQMQSC